MANASEPPPAHRATRRPAPRPPGRQRGQSAGANSEQVGPAADTAADTAARDGETTVQFDVTVVGGEAGRRLAVLQAEVILDVLTWLHEHQCKDRSDPPSG
jgi:hypothetical protein